MRLVFSNAYLYNSEGDEVYTAAQKLSRQFEAAWQPWESGGDATDRKRRKVPGSAANLAEVSVDADLEVYQEAVRRGGWRAGAAQLANTLADKV